MLNVQIAEILVLIVKNITVNCGKPKMYAVKCQAGFFTLLTDIHTFL